MNISRTIFFRRKTKTIEIELMEKVWVKIFGNVLLFCGDTRPSAENIKSAFKDHIKFPTLIELDEVLQRSLKKQFKRRKKWYRKEEDDINFVDW